MKNDIIETLNYPRYELRDNLDLEHCIHGGNFDAHDSRCLGCDCEFECRWLYENDECSATQEKTIAVLIKAMESAMEYVDARVADLGHNVSECQCDACDWLKHAESIYRCHFREITVTGKSIWGEDYWVKARCENRYPENTFPKNGFPKNGSPRNSVATH